MPIFTADTEEQACRMLAEDPQLVPLAGGTDLFPGRHTREGPRRFLDLSRLSDWRGIRPGEEGYRIGSLVCFSQIERLREDPRCWADLNALIEACSQIGGPQIRNRGTVGGNIQSASPAADAVTALLALEARVQLVSLHGRREVALEDFFLDYRHTVRSPQELIRSVFVPGRTSDQYFRKIGTRKALAVSVVSIAAVRSDRGDIRIAFGSVAPRPLVARSIMARLREKEDPLTEEEMETCLQKDLCCITDCRGSADYRSMMARRLLWDCLDTWHRCETRDTEGPDDRGGL